MAILPVNTPWGMSGQRQRNQPGMNYATDTQTGESSGGQTQTTATPAMPQLNMGFVSPPNSVYANARMRPGYGMPQGYMRGINIAPQPLPMRFQQGYGGVNPMAGQLAGQMGNVQVPQGMNLQNFAGRVGGMQGGMPYNMRPFPIDPSMLIQQRRGILPTGY